MDFSVVRNGKEDYSFFFSATQANVIEKALKNIVERSSEDSRKSVERSSPRFNTRPSRKSKRSL
ncbi:hypothetical protein [Bacillus thuringiensis]|uniref:hypothetical protein n=1 Tax=Bacillus cereus group TaxID=86661 RepID=UPI0027DD1599|nr:hypothetical protein [Bacillus thuringiensis]MEB9334509.1 hypothetical protein [Bacillus cereus]